MVQANVPASQQPGDRAQPGPTDWQLPPKANPRIGSRILVFVLMLVAGFVEMFHMVLIYYMHPDPTGIGGFLVPVFNLGLGVLLLGFLFCLVDVLRGSKICAAVYFVLVLAELFVGQVSGEVAWVAGLASGETEVVAGLIAIPGLLLVGSIWVMARPTITVERDV